MTDGKAGSKDNDLEYLSLVLYIISIIEILVFIILYELILASILFLFLFGALWFRRLVVDDSLLSFSALRAILSQLFTGEEDCVGVRPVNAGLEYYPPYIVNRKELISQLRMIGIDGLLILLFLINNENSLCSIKNIQAALEIPQSTLYRNISYLEGSSLVSSHQLLEDTSRYYQITELGRSQVEDLYLLMKVMA